MSHNRRLATWTTILTILLSVAVACLGMPDIHKRMAPQQLQALFHVDDASEVPHYEIVQVLHHNGDNEDVVTQQQRRRRRSIAGNARTGTASSSKQTHHVKKDLSKQPYYSQVQSASNQLAAYDKTPLSASAAHNVSFAAFGEQLNLTLRPTQGLFKGAPHQLRMWSASAEPNATHGLDLQELLDGDHQASEEIGEVYQDEANMAAILMRRHTETGDLIMEGSIGHEMVIKPLPTEWSPNQDETHHVVYKRESSSPLEHLSDFAFMEPDDLATNEKLEKLQQQQHDLRRQRRAAVEPAAALSQLEDAEEAEVEEADDIDAEESRRRTRRGRPRRNAPYMIYPEVLVIVDYDGYRLHGGDNLQVKRYFISFWNGVDLRYRLLKGPRIRISIAGIIISRGRDATPYLERNRVGRDAIDSAAALTDMGKYLFRERRLPVYDIAVAITKYDMCRRRKGGRCTKGTAGFAYVGGACVVNKRLEKVNSVAIIEDTGGFSGIIVAAHEVGHLLGAVHDGSPPPSYLGGPGAQRCRWEDGYIMSDLRHTERGFRWSPCTVQSFHHFLNGDTATCLQNEPHEDGALGRSLPGTLMTLDAQCRRDRGTYACFKDERVCAQLFCFDAQTGYCVAYRPAAEGSACGNSMHCLDGRCTPLPTNHIANFGGQYPAVYNNAVKSSAPIRTTTTLTNNNNNSADEIENDEDSSEEDEEQDEENDEEDEEGFGDEEVEREDEEPAEQAGKNVAEGGGNGGGEADDKTDSNEFEDDENKLQRLQNSYPYGERRSNSDNSVEETSLEMTDDDPNDDKGTTIKTTVATPITTTRLPQTQQPQPNYVQKPQEQRKLNTPTEIQTKIKLIEYLAYLLKQKAQRQQHRSLNTAASSTTTTTTNTATLEHEHTQQLQLQNQAPNLLPKPTTEAEIIKQLQKHGAVVVKMSKSISVSSSTSAREAISSSSSNSINSNSSSKGNNTDESISNASHTYTHNTPRLEQENFPAAAVKRKQLTDYYTQKGSSRKINSDYGSSNNSLNVNGKMGATTNTTDTRSNSSNPTQTSATATANRTTTNNNSNYSVTGGNNNSNNNNQKQQQQISSKKSEALKQATTASDEEEEAEHNNWESNEALEKQKRKFNLSTTATTPASPITVTTPTSTTTTTTQANTRSFIFGGRSQPPRSHTFFDAYFRKLQALQAAQTAPSSSPPPPPPPPQSTPTLKEQEQQQQFSLPYDNIGLQFLKRTQQKPQLSSGSSNSSNTSSANSNNRNSSNNNSISSSSSSRSLGDVQDTKTATTQAFVSNNYIGDNSNAALAIQPLAPHQQSQLLARTTTAATITTLQQHQTTSSATTKLQQQQQPKRHKIKTQKLIRRQLLRTTATSTPTIAIANHTTTASSTNSYNTTTATLI